MNLNDAKSIKALYAKANEIRKIYCGDEVHLRGTIEFSNYCDENCLFCGLREDNFSISRFRMTPDEIIDVAKKISNSGIKTVALQSGVDGYYDTDMIAYIIYSIKKHADVAISLALGERGFDEYNTWKIAGADRYFIKHEVNNSSPFSREERKGNLEDKVRHIKYLKKLGYQVGSGIIVGLPGQEIEEIVDDILMMQKYGLDMASIGSFIPAQFTPYQNFQKGSIQLTLKTIAIARLVLKDVHIPATTSLDTIDAEGREKGLISGANVIMPNFTPHPYRAFCKTYENKRGLYDDPFELNYQLQERIKTTGRKIAQSVGHSYKANIN